MLTLPHPNKQRSGAHHCMMQLGYNSKLYGFAAKNACPYLKGSLLAEEWESGYQDAALT